MHQIIQIFMKEPAYPLIKIQLTKNVLMPIQHRNLFRLKSRLLTHRHVVVQPIAPLVLVVKEEDDDNGEVDDRDEAHHHHPRVHAHVCVYHS